MGRRWLGALVLVAVASAPLSAELKVTSRMSVRAVPDAPPAADMLSQMMGPMLLQMFGGLDGVEMVSIWHEDGRTRTEYRTAFAGLPAGAVIVTRADGTSVGFDPKAETWWKMSDDADMAEQAAFMAQMKPEITTKKTGQFETLAGFRAERITLAMRMPIPLPPEVAQAPPEFLALLPREFTFEGDMWVAPQFSKYTAAVAKSALAGPLAQFGFDKLQEGLDGLAVRQVMRMNLLAGYEMETVVVSAVEEAAPASSFDVPAGFKEVPMPGIGGIGQ